MTNLQAGSDLNRRFLLPGYWLLSALAYAALANRCWYDNQGLCGVVEMGEVVGM